MGCDIHAHIEVKRGDRWLHYAAPRVERNRHFFTQLAGVHGMPASGKPVCTQFELPKDISEVTAFCYEQDAAGTKVHHIGWIDADQLVELQARLNQLPAEWMELDLEHSLLRTYINGNTLAAHQGWDDVRLVFWFDN